MTLRRWMISEVPDQYRNARAEALLARICEADEALESAKSHLEISRAREQCRFARFDAERLLRHFAPRQEISGPGGGPIVVMNDLERARRAAFLSKLREVHDAKIVSEAPEPPAVLSAADAWEQLARAKRVRPLGEL